MKIPKQTPPIQRGAINATFGSRVQASDKGVQPSDNLKCVVCKLACGSLKGFANIACLLACNSTVCTD